MSNWGSIRKLSTLIALCASLCLAAATTAASKSDNINQIPNGLTAYDPNNGIDIPVMMEPTRENGKLSPGTPIDSYHLEVSVDQKHRVTFNGMPLEKAKKKMSQELTKKVMRVISEEEKLLDGVVYSSKNNASITYKFDIQKKESSADTSVYYVLRQLSLKSDNTRIVEEETQRVYIAIAEDGSIKWAALSPVNDEMYMEYLNDKGVSHSTSDIVESSNGEIEIQDYDCNSPEGINSRPYGSCNGKYANKKSWSPHSGRFLQRFIIRSACAIAGVASCVFLFRMVRRYIRIRRINGIMDGSYAPLNDSGRSKYHNTYDQNTHSVYNTDFDMETVTLDPSKVAQRDLATIKNNDSSSSDSVRTVVKVTMKD